MKSITYATTELGETRRDVANKEDGKGEGRGGRVSFTSNFGRTFSFPLNS